MTIEGMMELRKSLKMATDEEGKKKGVQVRTSTEIANDLLSISLKSLDDLLICVEKVNVIDINIK